jgi:lipopolysaccharide transport system permease protein
MRSSAIQTLYSSRELLFAWTRRTIRARYQQSLLGGLWAILQPAAAVAIFSIIFTRFVPVDTAGVPYGVFAFVAMAPWTFFSTSITDMVEALTVNMNLVGKIYFPREVLPLAALLARLLDFAIASSVLALLVVYFGMPVNVPGLLLLPIIVAVQLGLALGVGLLGAAANVFFRDIKHLFTLVVEAYRAILLHGTLPGPSLIISAALAAAVLAIGYWIFKRLEPQFADVI